VSCYLQLLRAGLRCLKPGGRLVYSTCSLADVQNDAVVHAVLEEQKDCVAVQASLSASDMALFGAEPTQLGLICLPDNGTWGPIYVAVITKGY
jgi:16S rRNA C967 or C1407 C5-methylase (RsmB/RsmF family)